MRHCMSRFLQGSRAWAASAASRPSADVAIRSSSRAPMATPGSGMSAHMAPWSMPPRRTLSGGVTWHGTTILSVRKGNMVSVVGDGQVSMGSIVVKGNARKVRRIGPDKKVIAGFAGTTSDALTLLERLELKIDEHPGQLLRACVELAKDWRMDKYLRKLDALMLVCDDDLSLTLTGNGDVLDTEDGIVGIGSGGQFAIAAARALMDMEGMNAEQIATKSMRIAAQMCCYTNFNFTTETILLPEKPMETTDAPK